MIPSRFYHSLKRLLLSITALVLFSLSSQIFADDIWYDSNGKVVKMGQRYVSEFESYSIQRKQNEASSPQSTAQVTPASAPGPALPVALETNSPLSATAGLTLYYTQPSTQPTLHHNIRYHSIHPASYFHYNRHLYHHPRGYRYNYHRPTRHRQGNRSFGYFGNGTSFRIIR